MTLVTLAFSKTGVFHVWFYICSFESLCPAVSFGFHCKTDFCCVPKWREGQLDFFWFAQVADEYMFSLEESKKSKGRRQPLSKLPRHHPLVLQDCISDDGKWWFRSSPEERLSAHQDLLQDLGKPRGGPGWTCGLAVPPRYSVQRARFQGIRLILRFHYRFGCLVICLLRDRNTQILPSLLLGGSG